MFVQQNYGVFFKHFHLYILQYGTVVALLISRKKKGSAILEYDSPICAVSTTRLLHKIQLKLHVNTYYNCYMYPSLFFETICFRNKTPN